MPDPTASAPARRRRLRRVGFRAVTVVMAAAAALLAAEGLVRLVRPAPQVRPIMLSGENARYRWSEDPLLGYVPAANFPQDPKTNSHGFADVERPLAKPAGVRRVILLGDSVVEGAVGGKNRVGVEHLMSQQLERLYPDGKTQVLNLGVSGYCTLAEVELLRTRGLAFAPDQVVLVFVENDYTSWNMDLVPGEPPPAAARWLFLHSHLFRHACLRLDLFGIRTSADPQARNMNALGARNVERGLAMLKELSAANRFEARVAIWPTFQDAGPTDLAATLIVEDLAAANGLATHRLSEDFRRHFASLSWPVNPRKDYTLDGDGMHPTPECSRIAARALKAMLEAPAAPRAISPEKAQEARTAAAALGEASCGQAAQIVFRAAQALRDGHADDAIRQYEQALELRDDLPEAHAALGILLGQKGQWQEAAGHLEKAIRQRPDDVLARVNLGNLYLSRGLREKAAGCFREAQALEAASGNARHAAAIRRGLELCGQGSIGP